MQNRLYMNYMILGPLPIPTPLFYFYLDAAFTICFSPFACSSHMNDSDRTYVYE